MPHFRIMLPYSLISLLCQHLYSHFICPQIKANPEFCIYYKALAAFQIYEKCYVN